MGVTKFSGLKHLSSHSFYESEMHCSLAGSSNSVSHQITVKVLAKATVISRLKWESASKARSCGYWQDIVPSGLLDRRPQFLAGC